MKNIYVVNSWDDYESDHVWEFYFMTKEDAEKFIEIQQMLPNGYKYQNNEVVELSLYKPEIDK